MGLSGCLSGDGNGEENGETDGGEDGETGEGDGNGDEEPTGWRSELPEEVDVIAGPRDEGQYFEPEEIEITVGETVVWYFDTGGHNVTSDPEKSYKCQNPEGAEPFKSYEGDGGLNEEDSTFSHTFETPGEYTYVCVPHSTQMVGYVTVVEPE